MAEENGDPVGIMAKAMLKASDEEGFGLTIEQLQFLAIVGLQNFEPSQDMLSAGANCLDDSVGDEAERQELAKQVFSDMVLVSVQEPVATTHKGSEAEN